MLHLLAVELLTVVGVLGAQVGIVLARTVDALAILTADLANLAGHGVCSGLVGWINELLGYSLREEVKPSVDGVGSGREKM